ncbi:mannose-6-phosphate isomerase [Coccidioides immitis RS]|uniref:Mannose-6-phosphate isomerase n=4 Tax=Coccidioides immitis TaxID=5501 RepID=A0A0E1RWF9_COCIM|nr:mannose-6-phosphate isomerase [Coccidioides immitis RS]KMP02952.1 mannose-6-phosphate isomerase [Coccidioides immitis RMSCC 2394]KMU77395.1 mannose-6-phosphate isomerase [Coccidioides immitis RMSCC 3703]KMU90740.1 mannose-6-phosphate isomerase [Coccidioides immitis H538.4]TPX23376.1 Mannose-6-phosphate isomerase [Coccidioides immitis]EAS30409.2 mannose-6-phosphate isomerase [Coccidioides immitis RS]
MQVPLFRLQCGVNSYDWGKLGNESAAAQFAAASAAADFSVQNDKPYAELWMGTHPSLPSKDLETDRTLLDLVQSNQALLGPEIYEKYSGKLPFLFKVLSIRKALSIQAHPNKELAEVLHKRDPKNYPDDNHKPEMTIAITPFEGLCGFRPLAEIVHFLRTVKPFRELVGEKAAQDFEAAVEGDDTDVNDKNKAALRALFTTLMQSSPDAIKDATKKLVDSAQGSPDTFAVSEASPSTNPSDPAEMAALVVRLNGQFPDDIGLFVLFFLNFIKLGPGEAMFLKADDIHAYISGDIIECMASSDNVVRAGFTPKFKDVSTLTSMLTYSYAPIEEQKMHPTEYPYATLNTVSYTSGSSAMLYDPPIEEFSVIKTDLNAAGAKVTFEPISGPSVIICTSGTGRIRIGDAKCVDVKPGYVFFVGATAECVIENTGEEGKDVPMITFKAFCEIGP